MNSTPRERLAAIVLTLLIHTGVAISFVWTYMTWPPRDADDNPVVPVDSTEVLFINEFVNLGDMITPLTPSDAPEAPSSGESISDSHDLVNAGEKATPAPTVTSDRPSPMQVVKKEKPQKTGPTKEELAERERARREQAARDKIRQQMQFGGSGKGDGESGVAEGSNVSGSLDGQPGHDLAGRRVVSWGKNSSRKSGTIKVAVVVDRTGKVTQARYAGGDGPAAGDASLRARTVDATRSTRFSPIDNPDAADQRGTITWHFK